jgi:hypothetical protein
MRHTLVALTLWALAGPALAQVPLANSAFLLEEAWRADSAVNQHVLSYGDREWIYTWTQEYAAPERSHRFAWSASVGLNAPGSSQPGEISLDYVWQLAGRENDRVALAPHLAVIVPLQSRDSGVGAVVMLPMTIRHGRRAASHWNIRAGWSSFESGPDELAVAAGFVGLVGDRMAAVIESEMRPLERELVISPGVRWTVDSLARLGIAPGVAVPISVSNGGRSAALMFHVMFEHALSPKE